MVAYMKKGGSTNLLIVEKMQVALKQINRGFPSGLYETKGNNE